jgi:hypothetical protein
MRRSRVISVAPVHPRRRNDDPVCGIAMKRAWQVATFDGDLRV